MMKYIIFTMPVLLVGFLLIACDKEEMPVFPVGEEQPLGGCNDYNPLRNPYFGDLHVHTSYSFDSVVFGNANDPDAAYRFAKGETVYIAPLDEAGKPTVPIKLDRPLDFTAVTDHSETFAETKICYDKSSCHYYSPYCITMRGSKDGGQFIDTLAFVLGAIPLSLPEAIVGSPLCMMFPKLCNETEKDMWQDMQNIAETHYDRSGDCSFTTFIGYEYTGAPWMNNQHRNVIFRNHHASELPISYLDAPHDYQLWNYAG